MSQLNKPIQLKAQPPSPARLTAGKLQASQLHSLFECSALVFSFDVGRSMFDPPEADKCLLAYICGELDVHLLICSIWLRNVMPRHVLDVHLLMCSSFNKVSQPPSFMASKPITYQLSAFYVCVRLRPSASPVKFRRTI